MPPDATVASSTSAPPFWNDLSAAVRASALMSPSKRMDETP